MSVLALLLFGSRPNPSFGARGSQVQILPLRPKFQAVSSTLETNRPRNCPRNPCNQTAHCRVRQIMPLCSADVRCETDADHRSVVNAQATRLRCRRSQGRHPPSRIMRLIVRRSAAVRQCVMQRKAPVVWPAHSRHSCLAPCLGHQNNLASQAIAIATCVLAVAPRLIQEGRGKRARDRRETGGAGKRTN